MKNIVLLFAMGVVAVLSSSAMATLVGPSGPPALTTIVTSYGVDPGETEAIANIGTSGSPVPISFDELAGPWLKELQNVVLDTNEELAMGEYVTVEAPPSWTDWHETILTSGIAWSQDADDQYYTINGGLPQNSGIVVTGQDITITFSSPLPSGTIIFFHKELTNLGSAFSGQADVVEYPSVPEPATLSLLTLGGLAMLKRRM